MTCTPECCRIPWFYRYTPSVHPGVFTGTWGGGFTIHAYDTDGQILTELNSFGPYQEVRRMQWGGVGKLVYVTIGGASNDVGAVGMIDVRTGERDWETATTSFFRSTYGFIDCAVDLENGWVYCCLDGVRKYDLSDGSFIWHTSIGPNAEGVNSVALDSSGNIWCACRRDGRTPEEELWPSLVVLDSGGGVVAEYQPFQTPFSIPQAGLVPIHIDIDIDDNVYCACFGTATTDSLSKVSPGGSIVWGAATGKFFPEEVTIYANDTRVTLGRTPFSGAPQESIFTYDADGNELWTVTTSFNVWSVAGDPYGDLWAGGQDGKLHKYDSDGNEIPGELDLLPIRTANYPQCLLIDQ